MPHDKTAMGPEDERDDDETRSIQSWLESLISPILDLAEPES